MINCLAALVLATGQDLHGRVTSVDRDNAAARVCAGAAEKDSGHGSPRFQSPVPHEGRQAFTLEDVAAGQADFALDIRGTQDLHVDDGGGHVVAEAGD